MIFREIMVVFGCGAVRFLMGVVRLYFTFKKDMHMCALSEKHSLIEISELESFSLKRVVVTRKSAHLADICLFCKMLGFLVNIVVCD